jgi:DNA-binding transcriptional ArsR family regulator
MTQLIHVMLNSDLLPPLKALAHESRLRMIELLLSQSLCVGALAGRLGISEAATSQHLRILRKAGLVRGEKRGYWTHYVVRTEELHRLADRLRGLPGEQPGLRDLSLELGSGVKANQKHGGD